MSILYIADPLSIHDVRWINFFAKRSEFNCYLIARECHYLSYLQKGSLLDENVSFVGSVKDPSVVRPLRNLTQALKIKSTIRKYQIDIIHIMYAEPNALWGKWRTFLNVPIVLTTRGTDVLKTIPTFFKRTSLLDRVISKRYSAALNRVDIITCTSARQKSVLEELGVQKSITIIRTGVDFKLINESNENVSLSFGIRKAFVLMPRHMRPIYNHELTLDALELLPPDIKEKFSFVFVNSDTLHQEYFEEIRRKAELQVGDFKFLPTLPHKTLLSLTKQASLVIMNPVSDGSPVSAMEAMACKVPLILPPLSYDSEIFQYAYTFQGFSARSLSEMILKILSEEKFILNKRIQLGYDLIRKSGNTSLEMQKVAGIYKNLVHGISR